MYVRVGRSLYCALNWMNWVKKGSVWLVVPMAMALARVPMIATKRSMTSSMDTPLLTTPPLRGAFEANVGAFSRVDGLLGLGCGQLSLASQAAKSLVGVFYSPPAYNNTPRYLTISAIDSAGAVFVMHDHHRAPGDGVRRSPRPRSGAPYVAAYALAPPSVGPLHTCYNLTGHGDVAVPTVTL
ncbi:hypothetical protein ABZP36_021425 [Zizania latifolia]